MEIRHMAAVYQLGELGRPAGFFGGKSGPASIFSSVKDIVSLGGKATVDAGLYSTRPTFKVTGAVELFSDDIDNLDETIYFGDNPVLL